MVIDKTTDNPLVEDSTDIRNQDVFQGNPLVPVTDVGLPDSDGQGFMKGITAFEAGWQIAEGIDSGDWMLAVSGAVGLGLDVAGALIDPIGYVAAQLFSWMLEHIKPARAALDALAGNPDMVKGYAASWENIEQEMTSLHQEINDAARSTENVWQGDAGDAYRKYADAIAGLCGGAAGAAHGIASLTSSMAEVVGGVRTAVRDILAGIAGALVSYAIELAATVGAAAPVVVGQAIAKIAQVNAKIAILTGKLAKVVGAAIILLIALKDVFDGFHKANQALQQS